MNSASRWIYAVSFALAAVGFLIPLWPLSVLGVLLATLSGRFVAGLLIGLLLDIAWGAPAAPFGFLYFPFTLAALAVAALRYWGAAYFFDRATPDTL